MLYSSGREAQVGRVTSVPCVAGSAAADIPSIMVYLYYPGGFFWRWCAIVIPLLPRYSYPSRLEREHSGAM